MGLQISECTQTAVVEQEVDGEDPEGAAAGAGVFVPLHPGRADGEGIAEGEPGPAEAPVELVQVFKTHPEHHQRGRTRLHPGAALHPAVAHPGEGHEQGVDENGQPGAEEGGVPDPPGGSEVPGEEAQVEVEQVVVVAEGTVTQRQQGDEGHEKGGCKSQRRPGQPAEESAEQGQQQGAAQEGEHGIKVMCKWSNV